MKIILFLLLSLTFSCNDKKEEPNYSKEALYKLAQDADPNVTFVLPKSINEGVNCSSYSDGCMSAHIVKVKNIDLIAVEYPSKADAIWAAKKIRAYYVRNWVLDDVRGEPVLEKFVEKYLGAKKP